MARPQSNSQRTVLILGASGGFGQYLTREMAKCGWQVRALARNVPPATFQSATDNATGKSDGDFDSTRTDNIQWLAGDLNQPSTLQQAAIGADVIVHAVNVPYPEWDPLMINYTRRIIDLALSNHAHLMFVGNIYNAGIPTDGIVNEHSVDAPITEKGMVRSELERMIANASEKGLQSTIMRFGDFFGPGITKNNWFNECTKALAAGRLTVPGPMDIPHTWAYLPDAAKAMERVARTRLTTLLQPKHLVLPFAGHVFTFNDLKDTLEETERHRLRVRQIPWLLFRCLGVFIPLMRDLHSMRYLWNHDIRMDNTALERALGEVPIYTPLADAIAATCLRHTPSNTPVTAR